MARLTCPVRMAGPRMLPLQHISAPSDVSFKSMGRDSSIGLVGVGLSAWSRFPNVLPYRYNDSGFPMPRISADEKIAAIEKKLSDNAKAQAILKRELRAARSGQKRKTQSDRSHAAIVLGLGMAEHAARNP